MKILRVLGYFSYAAIPLGMMLWAFSAGMVVGFERFIQILFRVAISYAAAMAICVFGIQKMVVLNNWQKTQAEWVRALLQYLVYVVAFFLVMFVIGIMLLGDAIDGDEDFYPFMRR